MTLRVQLTTHSCLPLIQKYAGYIYSLVLVLPSQFDIMNTQGLHLKKRAIQIKYSFSCFACMLSPGHRARSSTAESWSGWAGRTQWSGAAEHQRSGQHGGQRKPLLQVSRGETEYVKAEERRDAASGSQVCSLLECFEENIVLISWGYSLTTLLGCAWK